MSLQNSDEIRCSEWIDNLSSYMKEPNEPKVLRNIVPVTDHWIRYFAEHTCPNISIATLHRLAQVSLQLMDRCQQPCRHVTDVTLLRKVLAVWRNICRSDDVKKCFIDSGLVEKLVMNLENLLQGEGSVLISVILQLLANITNDTSKPLCLWNAESVQSLYFLLLKTAKKEYDRNPGNGKLLLAFEMVWNNQFPYLVTLDSCTWNDSYFWNIFLGWIKQHGNTKAEYYSDILYCLFTLMERMAENGILCKWLFSSEDSLKSNDDENYSFTFPFVSILREALLVGERSFSLLPCDVSSLCIYFERFSRHSTCAVDSRDMLLLLVVVEWLELIAVLLADHFSVSSSLEEEANKYCIALVDSCCCVLRRLQEDNIWMTLGDKAGLKTTLTRLLCNICSCSHDMITYIVDNQQYLVTLLKQWQLDTEAPLSFEWTVFLFRLICERQEARPVIVETLQSCQDWSNTSQQ